jgi:hypothetical protein
VYNDRNNNFINGFNKELARIGEIGDVFFENETELIELIKQEHGSKTYSCNLAEKLFKPNSVKNIEREIKTIINSK